MEAEVALKALNKIKNFIPLDLVKQVEKVENYLHQQMFIDEEMKKFQQGFRYVRPEGMLSLRNTTAIYEDTDISDPIRPK